MNSHEFSNNSSIGYLHLSFMWWFLHRLVLVSRFPLEMVLKNGNISRFSWENHGQKLVICFFAIWGSHKWGTPKWMFFFLMEHLIRMDDEQGYLYFRKPPYRDCHWACQGSHWVSGKPGVSLLKWWICPIDTYLRNMYV